jgi:hypothetical protein
MTEVRGYRLMCVHATRRTRRDAPDAQDGRCSACHATILIHPLSVAYSQSVNVPICPVCPNCSIALADPDELVADVLTVPGTAEMLEAGGCPDGEAYIAANASRTIHDFAARALRNTVGGQG